MVVHCMVGAWCGGYCVVGAPCGRYTLWWVTGGG